ncbi:MAG: Type I transmembrane sorting receptor [Cirrosporium novae-zelandiae]|nr:MAG: Type I transmembrane sorting receptor [Cirrosporium novae-zelandiae]
MLANILVAVAAAYASVSLAAPAPPIDSRSSGVSFTLNQVSRGKVRKIPAIERQKTYRKFNTTVPAKIKAAAVSAAAAAESGQVTATPEEYDEAYYCPVTVGSDTLELDFDTGSADLWVFSSELSTSESSGHSIYTAGSSATKMNGYTWSITYADGTGAAGDVYKDTVAIGGVTVTSQAVEAATSVSSDFIEDTDLDGLVGLGFDTINQVSPTAQATWFDNVQDSLASPVICANLKYQEAGSYDIGFIDTTAYTGSLTYVSVIDSDGYWGFTNTGYAIGSGTYSTVSEYSIVDTGTTLIYVSDTIVNAYYKKVTGSEYDRSEEAYVFPCSADLPDLVLGFGTYKSTVPGEYLNYASLGSGYCYGGIQSNSGLGLSIFGDVWIKSQYVVFNKGETTMGAAAKSSS